MALVLRFHFMASYTVQVTTRDENNMFINTCWQLLLFLNWQSTKPGHAEDKFEINFWGCVALKAEERTAKRFEHDTAAAPSAYIYLIQKWTAWHFQHRFLCPVCKLQCIQHKENEWVLNLFFRFFVSSDASSTEAETIKLSGSRLFGIGIIADIFQRQGTKCEAWKRCRRTPLWSAQNF